MRRSPVIPILIPMTLIALMVAAGCRGGTKPVETAPPEPTKQEAVEAPAPEPPVKEVTEPFPSEPKVEGTEQPIEERVAELNRQGVLETVYFEFDSSELSPEAAAKLKQNADWIEGNPDYTIQIQGHCDERGTIEYNLALGERRANAVKDYLVSLGVDGGRLRTVTYGEEKPADPGHTEAAWAKNRRAEFLIEP